MHRFVRFAFFCALLFAFPVLAQVDAPAPLSTSGQLFQWLVNTVLLGAVTAIAAWVTTHVSGFIATWKNAAARNAADKLWAAVCATVQHAEAELRPTIDKDLEDGQLTPEEAKALKAQSLLVLKNMVPDLVRQVAQQLTLNGGGAIDTFLSGLLEKAVGQLPKSSPASASNVPADTVAALQQQFAELQAKMTNATAPALALGNAAPASP